MKKNQRSHLMDSNSDMGLTTRKLQSNLAKSDAPHYYEVVIPNHPNGVPKMHCGMKKDADRLLELYPDATMTKIYLPHPPQTVEVQATAIEDPIALPTIKIGGQEIPIQQNLPQSDLQALEL